MRIPAAANTQDSREHVRSNVFLNAVLMIGKSSAAVRIRNISTMGALLDGTDLPAEGVAITLRRGDLDAAAQVAWQDESHCGIRFERPINVEPWTKRVEHIGQRRVDAVVAALRAGQHLGAERPAEPFSLGEISLELCRVTEELGNLPNLTLELAEKLLRLDAVAQRLRLWAAEFT
jgi:hypothetical protein